MGCPRCLNGSGKLLLRFPTLEHIRVIFDRHTIAGDSEHHLWVFCRIDSNFKSVAFMNFDAIKKNPVIFRYPKGIHVLTSSLPASGRGFMRCLGRLACPIVSIVVKFPRREVSGLNIGNFNDFIATLTQDTLEQIAADANLKLSQARDAMDSSDPSFVGTQISALSLTISLELLGLYHKWLEQQL